MTTKKLGEICNISAGMVLNRFKDEIGKEYKLLTLRSVNKNQINTDEFDTFTSDKEIDTKYILKKGDIVMGLTTPYSVAMIKFDDNNVVVPSSFVIIRVKNDKNINPDYLAYYLNSNDVLRQIHATVEGAIIPRVSKHNLKNLRIKLIESEKEQDYVTSMNLLNERVTLKEKELELSKQVIEYYLNKI